MPEVNLNHKAIGIENKYHKSHIGKKYLHMDLDFCIHISSDLFQLEGKLQISVISTWLLVSESVHLLSRSISVSSTPTEPTRSL